MKKRRYSPRKKQFAKYFVEAKVNYFNQFYNFKINRIAIKNQSTRWGSCSSKRNLNFNYKIIYLKAEFADYLIVHELCHLGQLNHSKKFWELVKQTIPNYVRINKELKKISVKLL